MTTRTRKHTKVMKKVMKRRRGEGKNTSRKRSNCVRRTTTTKKSNRTRRYHRTGGEKIVVSYCFRGNRDKLKTETFFDENATVKDLKDRISNRYIMENVVTNLYRSNCGVFEPKLLCTDLTKKLDAKCIYEYELMYGNRK